MSPPDEKLEPGFAANRLARWLGVTLGISIPTLITWGYFILAADYSEGVQQATYLVVKAVQFAFPLLWLCLVLREPLHWRRPGTRGIALGLAFGIVVVDAGWGVYVAFLRDTPLFTEAAAKIRIKIASFGIDALWQYVLLACFYSLIHSLLEEYYWRWFLFAQLRRLMRVWPAIVISAAAFAGHHVVVLNVYFGGWSWAALLLSAAVAVGGGFWAWLYQRSGSLLGPWLSHLLIDAGVFWIGYDLGPLGG